jgi:hypothetical protein
VIVPPEGRWPPIYDAEGLRDVILELARAEDIEARFWDLRPRDDVYQGDVVQLTAPLPYLDETGAAFATEEDYDHWLVIGNTCDFARSLEDVTWTQLVPLIDLGVGLSERDVANLRSYHAARKFYVPPWPGAEANRHHVADFTRPVPIHKAAFETHARVVARVDYPAWVLLHSCLVRFLCRDDGRFD